MLVRDGDGREAVERQANRGRAPLDFLCAEPRVDQQNHAIRLHGERIAPRPGSEDVEDHHAAVPRAYIRWSDVRWASVQATFRRASTRSATRRKPSSV